jgi:superfamily I DNA and/or RNA helicase
LADTKESSLKDPDNYFQRLAVWLNLEGEAEIERLAQRRLRQSDQHAEASGDTLIDLVVEDEESGLGGRALLTLAKRNSKQVLPWNRLRTGSPVILSAADPMVRESVPGVVSGRSQRTIQIAVKHPPQAGRLRLDLSPDEITRKRQLAALRTVEEARGRTAQMRQIVLDQRSPRFGKETPLRFQTELNPSQQEAVQFAMAADDLAVIHGPPGTGKTTTVVELILQAVARGQRVLACGPSNTAVDNILQRLAAAGARAVRLGHPARVFKDLRFLTLDALVDSDQGMYRVKNLFREAEMLERKAERFTRAAPQPGIRRAQRREAREVRREARDLKRQIVDSILDAADVLCATTTFDDSILGDEVFDLVVIDEACQCTEAASWIPMLRADRVVLAGDHFQLPPTVLSKQAAAEGLETSLLERMIANYGQTINRRLTVQYRMHQDIMEFSSNTFYDGQLVADASVRQHRLCDLASVADNELTTSPMMFIDTAGTGWEEVMEDDGESKFNPGEADLVLRLVDDLVASGLPAADIAVIAPYAAQVRLLRKRCDMADLEIDTVDGFQGREKEAVVISLVRSNAIGEIGFLGDTRRMNVAMTRPRRKLIIIGDSATLAGHPFYAAMLDYFESRQAYVSAWQMTEPTM